MNKRSERFKTNTCDLLIWATNLEARATQLKCLGDQRALSFRPGHPSLNAWVPEGLPEIFPRAQPCSPVLIGSMIHYVLLLNVEALLWRTLVKRMQILVNYPHTLNIHGGNTDVSFVLSSKGTRVCNLSSSVLVPNRTSPSLLHTFDVDTLLNFPLPFNILTQTHPAFSPSGVFLFTVRFSKRSSTV